MGMKESSGDKQRSTNPKDQLGVKKAPMHLIPPVAKIHEAMAFKNGADKYGPYNWREHSVAATVYLAAAQRHIDAYIDGEDYAHDSGVHHLAHARACLGIMLDAESLGKLVDDRPANGRASGTQNAMEWQLSNDTPVDQPEQLSLADWETGADDPPARRYLDAVLSAITSSSIPAVYVAGPMRGYENHNFPAFDRARERLYCLGWRPVSPADLDRAEGIDPAAPSEVYDTPQCRRDFIGRDLAVIESLRTERGDAIALLPGWEASVGATAELAVARWAGLRVLDAVNGDEIPNVELDRRIENRLRSSCRLVNDMAEYGYDDGR